MPPARIHRHLVEGQLRTGEGAGSMVIDFLPNLGRYKDKAKVCQQIQAAKFIEMDQGTSIRGAR
jgi:hypothetical protein